MSCIKCYIALAYVQIVVNLRVTLRVSVQLCFQFLLFCEGHTRLELTHPISGCLLHDKCFIFG